MEWRAVGLEGLRVGVRLWAQVREHGSPNPRKTWSRIPWPWRDLGEGPSVLSTGGEGNSLLLLLETPPAQPPWSASQCSSTIRAQHFPRLPPSIVQGPEEKQEVKLGETESCTDLQAPTTSQGTLLPGRVMSSGSLKPTRPGIPLKDFSLLDFGAKTSP